MQISRSSMIYRSFDFHAKFWTMWGSDPKSLCEFVQKYFFRVLGSSLIWVFLGIAITSIIFTLVAYVQSFMGLPFLQDNVFIVMGVIIFTFAFALSGAALIVWMAYNVKEWFMSPSKKRNTRPNVFVEYIKAKKDKICPIVEYVD
jgi:hypothetical protein